MSETQNYNSVTFTHAERFVVVSAIESQLDDLIIRGVEREFPKTVETLRSVLVKVRAAL